MRFDYDRYYNVRSLGVREAVDELPFYPPTCKQHVVHLAKLCGSDRVDNRDLMGVLTDIDYRIVHRNGRGEVRGFSHDRFNPVDEFTLTIREDGTVISLDEVVKFERIGEIPRKYQS